jgi:hypothetical protein
MYGSPFQVRNFFYFFFQIDFQDLRDFRSSFDGTVTLQHQTYLIRQCDQKLIVAIIPACRLTKK